MKSDTAARRIADPGRSQVEEKLRRRARITEEILSRTAIDEPMIKALVHTFYDKVRADPRLGPVFEQRIQDWTAHLDRMCSFWSSVALMTGQYHGSPMDKHVRLPVDSEHFDRWLELFDETVIEVCPPSARDHLGQIARRVAQSLELGIAGNRGVLLGSNQRYREGSLDASGNEINYPPVE